MHIMPRYYKQAGIRQKAKAEKQATPIRQATSLCSLINKTTRPSLQLRKYNIIHKQNKHTNRSPIHYPAAENFERTSHIIQRN